MKTEQAILEDYLARKGLRMTRARQVVLDAFLSLETHVDAETIYDKAKQLDPRVGQSTVFRTVKLLADAGLARTACRDDGARHYEHAYNHEHHDHLACTNCGAVIEFLDKKVEQAQDAVYKQYGYKPEGHVLELYGVCPACAAK